MPLDYRLKKEKDFNLVFKKGKRLYSSSLTLVYFASKETKAGFCVSKKHGKSVQRNRIKRLLREAFRAAQEDMQKSYAMVLVPKVREEYSVKAFERDLRCIIKKEKL